MKKEMILAHIDRIETREKFVSAGSHQQEVLKSTPGVLRTS